MFIINYLIQGINYYLFDFLLKKGALRSRKSFVTYYLGVYFFLFPIQLIGLDEYFNRQF